MARPTLDDMKRERDGQLSYGPKLDYWKTGMFPKTTRIGYDADGEVVAVERSWGRRSGSLGYGDWRSVERWERTEAGRRLSSPE